VAAGLIAAIAEVHLQGGEAAAPQRRKHRSRQNWSLLHRSLLGWLFLDQLLLDQWLLD
jgi:hypothetical protein